MSVSIMFNKKLDNIELLFLPSAMSAVFGGVAVIVFIISSTLSATARNNNLKEDLDIVEGYALTGVQNFADKLAENQIINNLPLLMFWALVGLIVYSIAIYIYGLVANAKEIREEIDYVNSDKTGLLTSTAVRIVSQLGAFLIWALFMQVTFTYLLPYAGSLLTIMVNTPELLIKAGLFLFAFILLFATIHMHVVFVRLVALRYRLFRGN